MSSNSRARSQTFRSANCSKALIPFALMYHLNQIAMLFLSAYKSNVLYGIKTPVVPKLLLSFPTQVQSMPGKTNSVA